MGFYVTNSSDQRAFTTWQEFQNVTKKYLLYINNFKKSYEIDMKGHNSNARLFYSEK